VYAHVLQNNSIYYSFTYTQKWELQSKIEYLFRKTIDLVVEQIRKNMSNDYDRLKEYLNESKTSSNTNKFQPANVANNFMNFFKKSSTQSSLNGTTISDQNESDSWFREAESDPYCPKLVNESYIFLHKIK
jgi:hypothetical protein